MSNMNENEFTALISLLDDSDQEVSSHVWDKLMEMGRAGVDRLEHAWYLENDPSVQKRIEDLIQKINFKEVTKDLLAWRKGGGISLLEGWFLVTRLQYPDADLNIYRNELNRLVNKSWLEINDKMDWHDKFKVLNHILFVMEGFRPNKTEADLPANNFLNQVFELKRGNVITLSLIYLLICEKLDFPVYGVLLPGFFVLLFNDGETEFYIDVFNGGMFFKRKDLQRFLAELKVEEKPSYFKPTSNIYIVLQMLKQLASDFRKHGEPDKGDDIDQLLQDIEIRFD